MGSYIFKTSFLGRTVNYTKEWEHKCILRRLHQFHDNTTTICSTIRQCLATQVGKGEGGWLWLIEHSNSLWLTVIDGKTISKIIYTC